jgi:hypothetical protein
MTKRAFGGGAASLTSLTVSHFSRKDMKKMATMVPPGCHMHDASKRCTVKYWVEEVED